MGLNAAVADREVARSELVDDTPQGKSDESPLSTNKTTK